MSAGIAVIGVGEMQPWSVATRTDSEPEPRDKIGMIESFLRKSTRRMYSILLRSGQIQFKWGIEWITE